MYHTICPSVHITPLSLNSLSLVSFLSPLLKLHVCELVLCVDFSEVTHSKM